MNTLDALEDGSYTLVVDTIDDGLATGFVEQNGAEVGSVTIDVDSLPAGSRRPNAILTVKIADGECTSLTYDPERTETRKQNAQDRFDQLSSRLSDGDSA
jgi:Protein of unknown function (DUF3006).